MYGDFRLVPFGVLSMNCCSVFTDCGVRGGHVGILCSVLAGKNFYCAVLAQQSNGLWFSGYVKVHFLLFPYNRSDRVHFLIQGCSQ